MTPVHTVERADRDRPWLTLELAWRMSDLHEPPSP